MQRHIIDLVNSERAGPVHITVGLFTIELKAQRNESARRRNKMPVSKIINGRKCAHIFTSPLLRVQYYDFH